MNTSFPQLFLLITALSLDAFAASFVYGTDRVKIPAASVAVITALSTGILVLFLLLGKWFGGLIPPRATSVLCFLILFALGFIKLFDSTIKSFIRKSDFFERKVCFSISNLNFILTVYADPSAANGEDIAVLSPVEALSLGLALSLDSAAAGFGAGMMVTHLPLTILLSLLLNTAAVLLGSFLGRTLAKRSSLDLSWLSGLLLMGLALGMLL